MVEWVGLKLEEWDLKREREREREREGGREGERERERERLGRQKLSGITRSCADQTIIPLKISHQIDNTKQLNSSVPYMSSRLQSITPGPTYMYIPVYNTILSIVNVIITSLQHLKIVPRKGQHPFNTHHQSESQSASFTTEILCYH